MTVELLWYTPLEVADIAISKCYGKEPYKELEKQQARINRVANVAKHSSTIEHLVICVEINNEIIAQKFKENKFSVVTKKGTSWVISTNVRALQEIDLSVEIKHKLIPKEYLFMF